MGVCGQLKMQKEKLKIEGKTQLCLEGKVLRCSMTRIWVGKQLWVGNTT
jgi:hypothetical protein